jgi:GT2 family glycosyltransferase
MNSVNRMADEIKPLVSVIVVTLDYANLLRQCLLSLVKQDYPNIELIVVDNGSTEDIAGMLNREFPAVHQIRLPENTGFAGGTNTGIRASKGKYIAMINNDAAASPQWISAMVTTAESDPAVGAVGSIVIDGNHPSMLDSCGVVIALDGMSRQSMIGSPIPHFTVPMEVLAVSGCACLLRRDAIEQTGIFDERFFAYCEDTDLCLRIRRACWKIVVAPEANVTHYYSRTAGPFSLQKIFWLERNHYWVAFKNFPKRLLPLVPFVSAWRCVILAYAAIRRIGPSRPVIADRGPLALAAILLAAQFVALAGLPVMLWQRLTLRPPCRLSGTEMCRLLFRFRISVYDIITGNVSKN